MSFARAFRRAKRAPQPDFADLERRSAGWIFPSTPYYAPDLILFDEVDQIRSIDEARARFACYRDTHPETTFIVSPTPPTGWDVFGKLIQDADRDATSIVLSGDFVHGDRYR